MATKPLLRSYQPIWIKGEVHTIPYQRESEERYEVIRSLADRFQRPFSVLDIGSNYGYFDVRLMADFDCTCVMVDNKFVGQVLRANDVLDRSVVIQRHVSSRVLESLSRSEHFDIVLGLAVLHHFDNPERAYRAMRHLGWWSVFEIPGEGDLGAANPESHEEIRSLFGEPDGYFPSHVSDSERPYFVLENAPYLFEQTIDAADRDAPAHNEYEVVTDFQKCRFRKGGTERDFVPGMNLYNFQRLEGSWPLEETVEAELEKHRDHPDFQPWNFIVGKGITPIDKEPK